MHRLWSRSPISGRLAPLDDGPRDGDGPIDIYIDYRTQGGQMDVIALRSVREAVAASPDEFLVALDQLIETLGPDVPPAQKLPPESVAP